MSRARGLVTAILAGVLLAPILVIGQEDEASMADAVERDEAVPFSRRGADDCLRCHNDETVVDLFRTRHGNPNDSRSPFGEGQLQCEACHGPGGLHAGRVRRGEARPGVINFGSDADTPVAIQNDMCMSCHQGHVGIGWDVSPHGRDEVSCADCHQSHVARDPVSITSAQPEVCYTCHQDQRGAFFKRSAHPVRHGQMTCTGCHAPHESQSDALLIRPNLNETCYECHAEKRGPYLWEHAPVSEDCGNCHHPHGSNHEGILWKRGPLLCQQCHTQAGHPSVPFTTAGLPSGDPSVFLLNGNCLNCHSQAHGSNHPSGANFIR